MSKIIILIFLLSIFIILSKSDEESKPLIGILAQPSDYILDFPPKEYSYIMESYVELVEIGGGIPVPIFYDSDKETLKSMISKINGLILPGGNADIIDPITKQFTFLTEQVKYILSIVFELNDKGVFFPILAICNGFELGLIIKANTGQVLEKTTNLNYRGKIYGVNNESKIYSNINKESIQAVEGNGLILYNHNWGITPQTFKSFSKLTDFFKINSYSLTRNGTEIIAGFEALNYPFYAFQFHAELSGFNKCSYLNVDNSPNAVNFKEDISKFFIKDARKNSQKFENETEFNANLIRNWELTLLHNCKKSYFFKNSQLEKQRIENRISEGLKKSDL